MTTETVSPTEAVDQPATCAETVTELRRIADALEALGALPSGEKAPYLSLSLLLDTVEGVDAAAQAVLNKDAESSEIGNQWFHLARGGPHTGKGYLCVQTRIAPVDAREVELKELRQRVAELEATTDPDSTGLAYTRADSEPDDPTPVSPARVPLHTGSVVDGGELITDKAVQ